MPQRHVTVGSALLGLMIVVSAAGYAASERGGKDGDGGTTEWFQMPAEKFLDSQAAGRAVQPTDVDRQVMAAAIFHETNRRRQAENKTLLKHDPRLGEAARMHAASMAEHQYVGHADPYRPERRTPQDRARLAGFDYRFLAENVATHFGIRYESGRTVYKLRTPQGTRFSYQPDGPPIQPHTYETFAETLLDQWMQSPDHRANILSEEPGFFGSTCKANPNPAGMAKFYCVQMFGTPR